jgi:DNA polymerase I-like protein with 3'-5' exonuclease and polymerase domains
MITVGKPKMKLLYMKPPLNLVWMRKRKCTSFPPMYVGGYAEQDTALTLKLYDRLKHEIEKEECGHICDLETDLIPVTYAMKKKGVCIDEEKLHSLDQELLSEEKRVNCENKKVCRF